MSTHYEIITTQGEGMFAYNPASKIVATTRPNIKPGNSTGTSNFTAVHSPEVTGPDTIYPSVANWGKNNNWPKQIVEAMSDYGIGLNGLKFNRNLLHGKGVRLIQEAEDGKLNPQVVPFHKQKGIHTLLKNSRHKKYFRESANDYEYFSINFPQVILTKNFELVNKIVRTDPSDCRFQVMNPATKRIEYCFLSSKWHEGVTHTHESVEALPVADPLMTAEEVKAWAKKHKIYKFILPVMDTMVGRKYYPFKAWHAIVGNGWLEVALAVPALKKALFQNQMSIKYHVEIPEGYWRAKYSVDKWTNYSNSEKDRLRGETLDRINEWLTGVENTGKALITFYDVDEMGNELPQVRITAIDDKMKDGAYIPDTQNANIEILGSMDIDPTLAGFGFAGSKLGAGSGSDKRTAFNLRTSMKTPDRDVVLEPFDFAFEYNGYDESLRLAFIDHQLTTLDENPTGKQSVTEG